MMGFMSAVMPFLELCSRQEYPNTIRSHLCLFPQVRLCFALLKGSTIVTAAQKRTTPRA